MALWVRWLRTGLLTLSTVLALSLLYILVTRSEPPSHPSVNGVEPLETADAGIQDFRFVQSEAGAVKWEVLARQAHLFEGEQRARLEDVRVSLFGRNGRELHAVGDEGAIDTARKDFVLSKRAGVIAVELNSGYTIYTNHLHWSEERKQIHTADPVTISGHGLEVTGQGLVGKIDQEEFQVLQDVYVELVQ
jgi:lipopolysaccharide export system protein LptC